MEKSYEAKHHDLEADYWFFAARRDVINRLLSREPLDAQILEVGCSSGVLIQELQELGFNNIAGVDISDVAIAASRAKGLSNVYLVDSVALPFEDEKFDVLISSDVLEHIEDDFEAMTEWHRVLKPNGKIILLVPAFAFLWSEHDVVNKHFRRYSRRNLIDVFEKGGLVVERVSYWNFVLFLPISLVRLCMRLLPKSNKPKESGQLYDVPPIINWLLRGLLGIENALIGLGLNFPFGVSLLVTAVKE